MTGDETASLRNAVAALLARQAGGAMPNDLAAVRTRIHGIQQLDTVIGAMRGIAAAHAQQSRQLLPGFRAYAAVIAGAIASALRLREPVRPAPSGVGSPCARVVFCAEQGFVGGFAERILDDALLRGPADLFLIGSRGSSLAGARKVTVAWQSAMATQIDGITPLCIRIAAALYDFILTQQIVTAEVAFPLWTPGKGLSVACQSLLPLDERRFGTASAAPPPLTTLPPEAAAGELGGGVRASPRCARRPCMPLSRRTRRGPPRWCGRAERFRICWTDCASPSTGFGRKRSLRSWWSWQAVAWPRPDDVLRPNTRLCHANTASGGTPYPVSAPEPLSQPCP